MRVLRKNVYFVNQGASYLVYVHLRRRSFVEAYGQFRESCSKGIFYRLDLGTLWTNFLLISVP
jgi:hypothetical protein